MLPHSSQARQRKSMSTWKDRLTRDQESKSFNSVMARERNGSKQRLVPEYRDSASDGDSDDEGSWGSVDEDYVYTLNKKPKSQKSGDCILKAIAITSFLIIVALVIFIAWQHFTTQRQEVSVE